jgi:hypothetical protein
MPARAELLWDGKHDAKGNRVAPLRVALPFQTVGSGTTAAVAENRAEPRQVRTAAVADRRV